MPSRVSIPREHGAYLTLAGGAIAATVVAPRPLAALGVSVVLATAFLARGIVERAAVRAPLRAWDRRLGLALVATTSIGVRLAITDAGRAAIGVIALAAAALAAAAVARTRRVHRALAVEMIALGALGASAGLAAWAGLADRDAAIVLSAVLGAHAAAAVPIVRSALRPRSKPAGRSAAFGALVIAVIACVALTRPWAALAVVPRAIQLVDSRRARRTSMRVSPTTVGVRETLLLAAVVAIAIAAT